MPSHGAELQRSFNLEFWPAQRSCRGHGFKICSCLYLLMPACCTTCVGSVSDFTWDASDLVQLLFTSSLNRSIDLSIYLQMHLSICPSVYLSSDLPKCFELQGCLIGHLGLKLATLDGSLTQQSLNGFQAQEWHFATSAGQGCWLTAPTQQTHPHPPIYPSLLAPVSMGGVISTTVSQQRVPFPFQCSASEVKETLTRQELACIEKEEEWKSRAHNNWVMVVSFAP